MNSAQAKGRSAELVESGYATWLRDEIRSHAMRMFADAKGDDELRHAHVVYEISEIVHSTIVNNSRN